MSRQTPARGPRGEAQAEVEREFVLEDERVLRPLAERLREVADLLDDGREVEPPYVRRGVELWGAYLELHARRVRRLLAAFPEATGVPSVVGPSHPGLLLRWAGVPKPPAVAPAELETFRGILQDEAMASERLHELRILINLYEAGGYASRDRLAWALRAFLTAEGTWARFEERFVAEGPDGELPPEVAERLRMELVEIAVARVQAQSEVEAYVAGPIPMRAAPTVSKGSAAAAPAPVTRRAA